MLLIGKAAAQKREPGRRRKSFSSSVDSRPRISLRWGKRPKRAMTSRCLRAKARKSSKIARSSSWCSPRARRTPPHRVPGDRGLRRAPAPDSRTPAGSAPRRLPGPAPGLDRAAPGPRHRWRRLRVCLDGSSAEADRAGSTARASRRAFAPSRPARPATPGRRARRNARGLRHPEPAGSRTTGGCAARRSGSPCGPRRTTSAAAVARAPAFRSQA